MSSRCLSTVSVRRIAAGAAIALTLTIVTTGASQAADPSPDPVVAQRDSITLTASAVRALLASLDTEQAQKLRADPQALTGFVRDQMLQTALLDEARTKQWDQRADIAARAEQARRALIAETYLAAQAQPDPAFPSEQDISGAYEANKAKLLLPRRYHLLQVFIPLAQGGPPAGDDEAQARLTALRPLWQKSKDTAALPKKIDDKRPPAVASDLGWLREDQVVASLRTTIAGLGDGGVADPVRLADGWHLVRMAETKPAAPASLPEVRDNLVRALKQAKQQQNARAYLDSLLQRSPVQLNEIELAKLAK